VKVNVFFYFCATALILLLCCSATGTPTPWEIDDIVGKKAPDFTLKDIDGRDVSLSSLRGRVVLINFWATWCPPCRSEMPSLNSLYKEYRGKGLVVLAISTDRRMSDVKDYVSKNTFEFQILLDPDMRVSRSYKVFSIPTTFLIERNGVIIKRFLGEEDWGSPRIRNEIKKALSGIRNP